MHETKSNVAATEITQYEVYCYFCFILTVVFLVKL